MSNVEALLNSVKSLQKLKAIIKEVLQTLTLGKNPYDYITDKNHRLEIIDINWDKSNAIEVLLHPTSGFEQMDKASKDLISAVDRYYNLVDSNDYDALREPAINMGEISDHIQDLICGFEEDVETNG